MAVALARAARRLGATVTLVYGPATEEPPDGVRVVRAETTQGMFDSVRGELNRVSYDLVVAAAAVSDFRPAVVSGAKISSTKKPSLVRLEKTPKIVEEVKKVSPSSYLGDLQGRAFPARERTGAPGGGEDGGHGRGHGRGQRRRQAGDGFWFRSRTRSS